METTAGLSLRQITIVLILLLFFGFIVWMISLFWVRSIYAGSIVELDEFSNSYIDELFKDGNYHVEVINREKRIVSLRPVHKGRERICRLKQRAPAILLSESLVRYHHAKQDEMNASSWSSAS